MSVALSVAAGASQAAVVTFTDAVGFSAAATGTLVTEDFDTQSADFDANSTGNVIGAITTLSLIGGVGDDGPTRVRNNGFLEAEVDSSSVATSDGLSLEFTFASAVNGFALSGLQNDQRNRPARLELEELSIVVAGETFILSDVLGLTDFANGVTSTSAEGGPVFVGFRSDTAFTSFRIVHTSTVQPIDTGNNEEFWLDALVVDVAVVPLPSSLPILGSGMFALGLLGWRRRS